MSSPSTEELEQQLKTLKREIRQRLTAKNGRLSDEGRLLLAALKCVETKADKIWSSDHQDRRRPDRYSEVGFALKCDLEVLYEYIQNDGPVEIKYIAKWAIGMLAPLDEAIQVATEGKAELRPRKLVQGLPAELVKACLELSPAKFASAREAMSQLLVHNVSWAIQKVMTAAFPGLRHEKGPSSRNATTNRMSEKEGTSKFTEPVDGLAAYLKSKICTVETMQRLAIPVKFFDWQSFKGSEPAEPTTYASWLLFGLYDLYTSLQADHRVLGKWTQVRDRCEWCYEIVDLGLKRWKHLATLGDNAPVGPAGQQEVWSRKRAIYSPRYPAGNNPAREDSGIGLYSS